MSYISLVPDSKKMTLTWEEYEDEDIGDIRDFVFPGIWEVCHRCNGKGIHDHESLSNGFSMQDDFVDQDFIEDYQRGVYDVQCSVCNGRTTCLVIDRNKVKHCSTLKVQADLVLYEKIEEEYYQSLQEQAAERRAGC